MLFIVSVNKTALCFCIICFAVVLFLCSVQVRINFNFDIYVRSERMLPGQQSADYVVGQVSGSLFQTDAADLAAPLSAPLSALFSSVAPATAIVLRPPAEISASISPDVKKQKPAEVRGQPGLTCKRKNKMLIMQSKAEQRLEGRSALLLLPPPV